MSLQAYEVSPEVKLQKCQKWAFSYDEVDWNANPDIGPWCGKDYAYYYNLAIKDMGPKGKDRHKYQCEKTVGKLDEKEWESRRGSVCTKGYAYYSGAVQEEGLKACKSKIWDYDRKSYKGLKEDEQSIFDFNKAYKSQCPKGFAFYKDLVDKETAEYRKVVKETLKKQPLYTTVYSEIGDSSGCQWERTHAKGLDNHYVSNSVKDGKCPSFEAMDQAKQARKDKAKSDKSAELKKQEMATIENIAKGVADAVAEAEMLAVAKSHGFNSYKDYQLDEDRKIASLKLENELKGKTYKAVVGCRDALGRNMPVLYCLKSAKIDGRFKFRNSSELSEKYDESRNAITLGLSSAFNLQVKAKKGAPFFYVKITNISTGEEAAYEEKEGLRYISQEIIIVKY